MIILSLFEGWICERIYPCDKSNRNKYSNYVAVINGYEDGVENRTYLKESKDADLWFYAAKLEQFDIVVASCWQNYKRRQVKQYYIVHSISETELCLYCTALDGENLSTYRKAKKAQLEYMAINHNTLF